MLKNSIFLLALCGLAVREIRGDGEPTTPPYRLPGDTQPVAYVLNLAPEYKSDINKYSVHGQVEILIKVITITPNITLNAKDMAISSVVITDFKTQKDIQVDGNQLDTENERLTIYVGYNLLAGRLYQLKIVFQTPLRTDMTGFYKSTYTEDNTFKWFAVSQFKPTYARRAFPCYDEPSYRTPFNITLGRQDNQMTLSNTRVYFTQRLQYGNWWADYYEKTPPISTYSVGVLVGELKKFGPVAENTIYTYDDYLSQTNDVLDEVPPSIKVMENYTNTKSEVTKIDIVAVPDFNAEGAGNWGINMYREKYVLLDDDAKAKFRELSTTVVQQQQSYQWFGNLVTCSWWDYLWLNEGFAKYFQYFATRTLKSDWRMEEFFVVEQHQTALEFDQTPRHPVTVAVNTTESIQNIFDRVTYSKAAAILRMLKYTVTESNFKKPLQLYLQEFKYGTTSPSILWSVFENYYFDTDFKLKDDVQFTDFILSWTDQTGYPVIDVKRNIQNGAEAFNITQNQFSIWPSSNDTVTRWYVGITYTTSVTKNFDDLTPIRWLKPSSNFVYIRSKNVSTWYIFNLQSAGFYRVNYEKENWKQLVHQLNFSHSDIHVLNRAQLVDDSFNLARAGLLEYATALDLSNYLEHEDDVIPWYTAIDCLSYIVERMRRSTEGYDFIKSYVRNLAEMIYQKTEKLVLIDPKNHTLLTSWNKFSVWACYLDSEYCIQNALVEFKKWSTGQKISPDLKDAVLCTGIKSNDSIDIWKGMLNVYITTKSASEKNSAQTALTCSQNSTILYNYLELLFDSNNGGPVRLQDFRDICDSMSLTPQGIEALTNFLNKNNIETILKTVPTGESIITYVYDVLASKVALDNEILKLNYLKNANGLPPKIKASFDKSYVQVEQNLRWYNSYYTDINQWTGAPTVTTESTTVSEPTTITTNSPITESSTITSTETPPTTTNSPITESSTITSTEPSPITTNSPITESSTITSTETSPTTTNSPITESSTITSTETPPTTTNSPITESSTITSTEPSPTTTNSPITESSTITSTEPSPTTTNSPITESSTITSTEPSPTTTNSPITESSTIASTVTLQTTTNSSNITRVTFDFDNTTPGFIIQCPNKSNMPSYRNGSTFIVVIVAFCVSFKSYSIML